VTTVSISTLKARISEYFGRVKAGEELTVTERGRIIGHIVPRRQLPRDRQAELEEMAREGLIRLPKRKLPKDFLKGPFPSVPGNAAVDALLAEREESPY